GMAQGLVMSIFADCYRRTGNPIWKDRAYEVLNSFKVNWADGGVRLADTTHGYWWEEFHPIVKVWNGSAQALIDVGYLWKVTNDPEVKRMFDRGIESLKYYTPQYDTGTWTIYSLTQGRNSVFYNQFEIELLDTLYDLSGDPWFKSTADRWRTYTPPPGVS
ncbi:MAG TPA: D-glucuronyl C5-epimerase family protein, partial [Gemmatimonadales bacterium]|nr:D-glucuronyl C5-epimerase family protein [Gemmatimonadales bacterium]